MPTYTVTPIEGSKRWAVLSNGQRVSRHNKKANALKKARKLKRNNGGSVTVKARSGKFHRRI